MRGELHRYRIGSSVGRIEGRESSKRLNDVIGDWRKLQIEEHVACVVEKRNAYRDLGGGISRKDAAWKSKGVDGRIILNWILNKLHKKEWSGFIMTDFCEHGNEPSGYVKCGEFLE